MKKTYIIPESLTIQLVAMQMMAQSLTVYSDSDAPVIDDQSQILTKENNSTDKGVWDEEW
ncbi:MAG: hypothetical protein IJK51_06900 [Bacteroidaceae bacterium]|jgi:hypothetical protein|nr:hypothetical protein [Bacteroidaceae bacterium]